MKLEVTTEVFPLAQVFAISRGARTEASVVRAVLTDGEHVAHGECVPYARYDETCESVTKQLTDLVDPFDHDALPDALGAGAARNALDCALWDLKAKKAGRRIWDILGLPEPKAEITAYTLSLDTPEKMEEQAAKHAHRPLLKTKLGGSGDVARIEAVRRGAPQSRIIVDANEGWTLEMYQEIAPALTKLGVEMVEQPFPSNADEALLDLDRILPVCADESCHDSGSLKALAGKYDMINIKLDKTGGLTEALALKKAGIEAGYQVMVGCMVGTSLGMAPATLLAQGVAVTDLDGPLLMANDRPHGLKYDENGVHPPLAALWG